MIDVSQLWVTEWVVIGFFGYLIVLARLRPLTPRQRGRVVLVGLVCGAVVFMLSQLRLSPILRLTREWLPAIYLIEGYWLCSLFLHKPMLNLEARLIDIDRWVFRVAKISKLLTHGPRIVLEFFELMYLLAYSFVPVAFVLFGWLVAQGTISLTLGDIGFRASTDSFWTALLIAAFGCYGLLPWIQTRPPRNLERASSADARGLFFRRLNIGVLRKLSVQVNTFPSGHAAVTVAAALAVTTAIAIPIYAGLRRGRFYAIFSAIVLGVAGVGQGESVDADGEAPEGLAASPPDLTLLPGTGGDPQPVN